MLCKTEKYHPNINTLQLCLWMKPLYHFLFIFLCPIILSSFTPQGGLTVSHSSIVCLDLWQPLPSTLQLVKYCRLILYKLQCWFVELRSSRIGPIYSGYVPFCSEVGWSTIFFQICRFFQGGEISNIFWSLDVKNTYLWIYIFPRLKKTWCAASFEPRSDEVETLRSKCSSTELAGPGLFTTY